jgi:hypothetical protein
MNVIWIVAGVAIAGAIASRIIGARNGNSEPNLGFVSRQWIAEHRLS